MTDRYQQFATSSLGKLVVNRLGLPSPVRLRRYQPGQPHNPPYLSEQSWGAWFMLFAYAIWISRKQFAAVFRTALRMPGGEDDSREPLSYRAAVIVGILAAALPWQRRWADCNSPLPRRFSPRSA